MQANTAMSYILIGIMMVCGYIFLLQVVAHRTTNRPALPLIAILLLLLYLLIGIPFVVIIFSFGSLEFVLLIILTLISGIVLFTAIAGMIKNFRRLNKGMLALFLTYAFAVGYITILSRDGTNNDTTIFINRMDLIQEALRTHSIEPLNHMLLNLALFVPLGFLFPYIYPEKLNNWSYALLIGLMGTTVIEATQMVMGLGQADLSDVITNALGCLIGYIAYRLVNRVMKSKN